MKAPCLGVRAGFLNKNLVPCDCVVYNSDISSDLKIWRLFYPFQNNDLTYSELTYLILFFSF